MRALYLLEMTHFEVPAFNRAMSVDCGIRAYYCSTYSVVHRILDPMIPDLRLSARSAVVFPFCFEPLNISSSNGS